MKNGLMNKIFKDMKNFKNYICLFLLLLGMSVSQEVLGQVFTLVSNPASTLANGDEIIFVQQATTTLPSTWVAMEQYSTEKTNKFDGEDVTVSEDHKVTLSSGSKVTIWKVKKVGDNFAFHNGSGFLQASSSNKSNSGIEVSETAYSSTPSGLEVWVISSSYGDNISVYNNARASDNSRDLRYYPAQGSFGVYTQYKFIEIYKKDPTVMFYQGVGGNEYVTATAGAVLPTSAKAVPGWDFIQYWSTDKNWAGDWSQYSKYTYADGTETASGYVYYAVYQGNVTGCNNGDISCKPQPVYSLSLTNSSGSGVNWVVADVGCGPAGTTVTLTYTINVPGTSYQGATITRDDNGGAVSFVHDAEEQTVTFTFPASDVTAEISFECPDLTSKTVTINDIEPYYDNGVWKANVTWGAVTGATQYGILVNDETGSSTFLSATYQTGTSYLLTGLTEGHTYRAGVRANNPCTSNNSTPLATKDFTPTCPTLTGTLAISKDAVGQTSAAISWGGVTTTAIPTGSGSSSVISYDVSITVEGGAEGGVYSATGTTDTEWSSNSLTTNKTYTVTVHAYNVCGDYQDASTTFKTYNYIDYQFTCADLSLTDEDGTHAPIWITSTAGKMVRSQKALHIEGTGLKPNGAITFTIGGVAANNCASGDVFAIRQANGSAVAADASGNIDMDVYVFYQPSVATDGLDLNAVGTAIVATSAEGTVPPAVREYKAMSATLANVAINGRHLPADFVIAAKNTTTNKWYALPANMSGTGNPEPVEIAVDDINNPTIAYTAASNVYNLYLSADKEKVQLGMKNNVDGSSRAYALWANNAVSSTDIGKNTGLAENTLGNNYKWTLTQTNTSITNPQDAKYTISNLNNVNPLKSWFAAGGGPKWGLYASGESELRLIPASDIVFTEAYFVEWAQHGGVVEVDAEGVDATSVVAHLGEATSSAITLSQTLTSGKSRASKYNYTVNFGGSIDFAAATSNGAMLTLEWKKGETVKAMSNIVVPKIIASSATMKSMEGMSGDTQWETEVHVLPGVTLTANAGDFESNDVMIKQLEIYPGATVVVTKGSQASGTLKVKTLVLRNGWTRAGEKAYDVARLYITPSTASLAKSAVGDVWYADWYIDYDQYYPVAVPWDVTLANITYRYCSVEPTVGHDKNIRLRYYDGEGRASSGQSQIGQNWKLYGASGADDVPTKLEPSKGYALTAKRPSGKAFSILRMPMTIPSADWTAGGEKGEVSSVHKNQVSVTGWGKGTADWYAMGWNFIGNPYMCTFNGDDDGIGGKLELQNGGSIKYATIPDVDFKNYDQVVIAEANLKPASGFFVQANDAEAKTITFNASKIVDPTAAPARYTATPTAIPEQEAYIRLSYEGGKDQMGLIIDEDYTENYEVNADLAKVLGDAGFVKTYMQYGGMDMAYVAINSMLAREWIPVTVKIPAAGEYTYSLMNSSTVDELEGLYLIDYLTGTTTNLLFDEYTFTAEEGTLGERFAINAIVGDHKVPTGADVTGLDSKSNEPIKFIWHDKVFILHGNVIYDSTGKRVSVIKK